MKGKEVVGNKQYIYRGRGSITLWKVFQISSARPSCHSTNINTPAKQKYEVAYFTNLRNFVLFVKINHSNFLSLEEWETFC
jgi:hypothetical protein